MCNYLALGDSITVGVGAPHGEGYTDVLTYYLQNHYPLVYTKKISHKGWRSKNLFSAISKKPNLQQLLFSANLITLYIGGNDLGFAFIKSRISRSPNPLYKAIQQFSININELLRIIRSQSTATILIATQYNPFPYSPLASQFIQLLNQSIMAIAKNYSIPVVDVYHAFSGRESVLIDGYCDGRLEGFIPLLQKNPIHPNVLGHQLIANCFWRFLQNQ